MRGVMEAPMTIDDGTAGLNQSQHHPLAGDSAHGALRPEPADNTTMTKQRKEKKKSH